MKKLKIEVPIMFLGHREGTSLYMNRHSDLPANSFLSVLQIPFKYKWVIIREINTETYWYFGSYVTFRNTI